MAENNKYELPAEIANHPDRARIMELLNSNIPLDEIVKAINKKYSRLQDKDKRISLPALEKTKRIFKAYKVQTESKEEKAAQKINDNFLKKAGAEVNDNYTALEEKAKTTDIHVESQISTILVVLEERTKRLYNTISNNDYISEKDEKAFITNVQTLIAALEKLNKFRNEERALNSANNTNININIMNDQLSIIRGAIKETLMALDPSMALLFMSKLNEKLNGMNYSIIDNSHLGRDAIDITPSTKLIDEK